MEEVNFKKQVICSKPLISLYLVKEPDLEDFPTIKLIVGQQPSTLKQEQWHWAAVLCTNSWRTAAKRAETVEILLTERHR